MNTKQGNIMKKLLYILGLCAFLFGPAGAKTITVDGNISDWADVPVLATDPAGDYGGGSGICQPTANTYSTGLGSYIDLRSLKLTSDTENLYYLITFDHAPCIYTGTFEPFRIEFVSPSSGTYPPRAYPNMYNTSSGSAFYGTSGIYYSGLPAAGVGALDIEGKGSGYVEGAIPRALESQWAAGNSFSVQTYPDTLSTPATYTFPSSTPPSYSLSPTSVNF
jgi:hypothetical protein